MLECEALKLSVWVGGGDRDKFEQFLNQSYSDIVYYDHKENSFDWHYVSDVKRYFIDCADVEIAVYLFRNIITMFKGVYKIEYCSNEQ